METIRWWKWAHNSATGVWNQISPHFIKPPPFQGSVVTEMTIWAVSFFSWKCSTYVWLLCSLVILNIWVRKTELESLMSEMPWSASVGGYRLSGTSKGYDMLFSFYSTVIPTAATPATQWKVYRGTMGPQRGTEEHGHLLLDLLPRKGSYINRPKIHFLLFVFELFCFVLF